MFVDPFDREQIGGAAGIAENGPPATPVRLMDRAGGAPTGVHPTSVNGTDKLDIAISAS